MLDRLITDARVFDGQRFLEGQGVGIAGDRIAYVGPSPPQARIVTDAGGKILSPAFIDCHSHADFQCLDPKNDANSALSQGVGTVVVGHCGLSATPVGTPHPILLPSPQARCVNLAEHRERLNSPLPVDVADLLGHNMLRTFVLGDARPATASEIDRMAGLLDEFLAGGGLGLSVGLNYPEAEGYNEQELLALCRVLARHGRPLTCHIRDQAGGIVEAVEEVARLGDQTGIRVVISHLRPVSDCFDHLLPPILKRIESSDHLAMDLYPYVAGFTSLAWLFSHLFGRLPQTDDLFPAEEVESGARQVCIGGLADIHLLRHQTSGVAGHTVPEIAEQRGEAPGRVAQDLLLEDPDCLCIYDHESTPEAVERVITHPRCLIGSDGHLFPTGFRDPCHPRSFATFTGFLFRYVRTGKVSLEDGLAKMTRKTAEFFNLKDRGEIAVGKKANLTLFRLEDLEEQADFKNPSRPSRGMREVILAGRTVWKNGVVIPGQRLGGRACPAAE